MQGLFTSKWLNHFAPVGMTSLLIHLTGAGIYKFLSFTLCMLATSERKRDSLLVKKFSFLHKSEVNLAWILQFGLWMNMTPYDSMKWVDIINCIAKKLIYQVNSIFPSFQLIRKTSTLFLTNSADFSQRKQTYAWWEFNICLSKHIPLGHIW